METEKEEEEEDEEEEQRNVRGKENGEEEKEENLEKKKEAEVQKLRLNKRLSKRALWFRTTKNRIGSTGSLAHPFTHSLLPLTHLLAPNCLHCSHCSRAPLNSFRRSIAHSLAPELLGEWMILCLQTTWFCPTVKR